MKKNKDSIDKLLKFNKNLANNNVNKPKLRLGRVKSQENIYQQNRPDIKSLNNKNFPINLPMNRNIIFKKNIRKFNKNSFSEMSNNNKFSGNKKMSLINTKASKFNNRINSKIIKIEHGNDIGRLMITNSLYDDIKIRDIINLWNELEVNESYRKYFFFIYKELGQGDKDNFYNNEINELIQLKNSIKNLDYNIELRIGIIQKLYELNEKLNKQNEIGEADEQIIREMYKKLEALILYRI